MELHELSDAELDQQLEQPEGQETETETPSNDDKVKESETEPPTTETSTQPPVESSELEKLKKQLTDAQSMIGRLGNELGQLRKAAHPPEPKKPVTTDDLLTDPEGTISKIAKDQLEKDTREKTEKEEQAREQMKIHAEFLTSKVPDIKDLIPEMAEVALSDGVPQQYVDNFKQNILIDHPFVTLQLAKRAQLLRENKQLKAEVENLKKKPNEMLTKINQASKMKPTISPAETKPGKQRPAAPDNIALMSDQEIDALLEGE